MTTSIFARERQVVSKRSHKTMLSLSFARNYWPSYYLVTAFVRQIADYPPYYSELSLIWRAEAHSKPVHIPQSVLSLRRGKTPGDRAALVLLAWFPCEQERPPSLHEDLSNLCTAGFEIVYKSHAESIVSMRKVTTL